MIKLEEYKEYIKGKWGRSFVFGNEEENVQSWEFGVPTKSQLDMINQMAKRPLSKGDVFVFSTKMVGDKLLEERNLKLHKTLLESFKKDAQAGVALMVDHPWAGLLTPKPAYPYGRSFNAKMKKGDIEGETVALHSDKYIVRGREKDGLSTDNIIADIEDGVYFDTSVGFMFKTFECSVCGNDIRKISECEHYPGQTYEGELCYVIAKPPGVLMEESLVFDGAYPTAGVLSQHAGESVGKENELVPVEDFKSLKEETPIFNIYSGSRSSIISFARSSDMLNGQYPGVSFSKGGDNVEEYKEQDQLEEEEQELGQELNNVINSESDRVETEQEKPFITKDQAVESLGKEYDADTVLRLAREGANYRKELVEEAIEWGVRAQGNDFPADSWRQMLSESGRSLSAIMDFRDEFKKRAVAEIPSGRTTDPEAGSEELAKSEDIPDDCYKSKATQR